MYVYKSQQILVKNELINQRSVQDLQQLGLMYSGFFAHSPSVAQSLQSSFLSLHVFGTVTEDKTTRIFNIIFKIVQLTE